MRCPKDNSSLQPCEWETGIAVDNCPSCGGNWLDPGELERLQETVERDYGERLAELPDTVRSAYDMAFQLSTEPFDCPACDRELTRREYSASQVVIDVCPECQGTWLDKGELESLEIFFERAQKDQKSVKMPLWVHLLLLLRKK